MWNLGRNPAIYKQPTEQLRTTFTHYEGIGSQAIAAQLPLINAVLNESMRLNPVLPGPMWRRTGNPIPVAGYAVPPGGAELSVMRLSVYQHPDSFHRSKEFVAAR